MPRVIPNVLTTDSLKANGEERHPLARRSMCCCLTRAHQQYRLLRAGATDDPVGDISASTINLDQTDFCIYINLMEISYDPGKRATTLEERGLDFVDVPEVFSGPVFELVDDRFDYGEERYITIGMLRGRMVVLVWTPRGAARHIISMRKANDREQTRFQARIG